MDMPKCEMNIYKILTRPPGQIEAYIVAPNLDTVVYWYREAGIHELEKIELIAFDVDVQEEPEHNR